MKRIKTRIFAILMVVAVASLFTVCKATGVGAGVYTSVIDRTIEVGYGQFRALQPTERKLLNIVMPVDAEEPVAPVELGGIALSDGEYILGIEPGEFAVEDYTVKVYDLNGDSDNNPDTQAAEKPEWPLGAGLQFTGAPSIELVPGFNLLAWTITASDPEAASYDVYWVLGTQTDAATVKTGTKIEGATPTGTITGLADGTTYSVMVSARKDGYAYSDSAIVLGVPELTYQIGDSGPAGGTIFYVNPNYTADGWRYMEAAPEDTVGLPDWGAPGIDVSTGEAIGTGKQNTANIMAVLTVSGETGKAAQVCDAYTNGGYDDWFLPSKDELNEMYQQRSSIGVFRTGSNPYYWSSSHDAQDNQNSLCQDLTSGHQSNDRRYGGHPVRAVRAF
jgi:hypothetical protein